MSRPRHTLGISKLRRAQLVGGPYIELISKHEQMVRCLYQTFAIAFPGMKRFWNHLADEEEQHFRLIKALEADIRSSEATFNRPKFTQSQVQDSIAWICARKERVQRGQVSISEALSMCIQIENGMVEHRFFEVIDEDHADIRKVLSQLEKSTVVHLRRARKEANRMKWKMFGGKKSKPIPEAKWLTAPIDGPEDSQQAVKLAQAAILASLISLEEAAGWLYNAFAELLPEQATLWGSLSADEMAHASMLHKLEDMVERGEVFRNMGQFGVDGIKRCFDDILNAETKARRDGITANDAMVLALRVESYMAECEFYQTVASDAPEFKYIAERLIDLTSNHIHELRKASTPVIHASTQEKAKPKITKEEDVDWSP